MSRRKNPTAVQDARGYFRKHPDRKRDGEPVVTEPLGAVPEGLKPGEMKAWQEIAEICPLGVLTQADRPTVLLAAKLYAEFMGSYAEMANPRLTLLNRVLGQLGLNPSDRASMSIPQAKPENPFAAL